ncbi:MAG: VacJ family lipoprotein [Alphaproteobacteria bacterium]
MTFRRARAVGFLVLVVSCLGVPNGAGAVLAPEAAAAIAREAAALGAIATSGPAEDPSGVVRDNAEARMATVVIAAIAGDPANHGDILVAATAAAPALADGVRERVMLAYPGFAADFVAPPEVVESVPVDQADAGPIEDFADVEPLASPGELVDDPIEEFNRVVFTLNDAVDTLVLRPIAAVYGFAVPLVAKQAVADFYRNLKAPVVFANDLFQGNVTDGAAVTLGRFLVNSTIGVAGLIDMAGRFGLPWHDADFGQTLYAYGVGPGPYLVLPLFGPSTARDAVGTAADSFLDPLGYILPFGARLGLNAGKAVSKREAVIDQLDQLRFGSLDFYAAVRGAYYQHRGHELGLAAGEFAGSSPGATPSAADEAFEEFE